MPNANPEFEQQLDDLSPGTRETLIVAAHKDDRIWNDTVEAHSLDAGSGALLRDYIVKTYDPAGNKLD